MRYPGIIVDGPALHSKDINGELLQVEEQKMWSNIVEGNFLVRSPGK